MDRMKKWDIQNTQVPSDIPQIIENLLIGRGLSTKTERERFLHPSNPFELTADDVLLDKNALKKALIRIKKAIADEESIVVYADYDADGITAGTIMWETLYGLGARVMPYIPHRVDEGYGLSTKGIDNVKAQHNPTLIITVDHGITAWEKVEYAKSLGIDVIVTDHHTKPEKLPDCTIVHTTSLCGAGVSWFVAKSLLSSMNHEPITNDHSELLALAAIGTIADLVPLIGPNRSIVKYGLAAINNTARVGLNALILESGLTKGELATFDVSHVLAPRLNAMGRLMHAMDALRLLCTKQEDKAMLLARTLGLTNKDRQQLTIDISLHAKQMVETRIAENGLPKLLFIAHESYNQGVIGLAAGKLVEEYYRPSIVLFKGETISKASARSIVGFNIVEAIKLCSDLLIDVGGHPMAAGFTVETRNLEALQERLEAFADKTLNEEHLKRVMRVDELISLEHASGALWTALCDFEPFGFGNMEPVFASYGVNIADVRLIGKNNKHLKLKIRDEKSGIHIDAVAFNMGQMFGQLKPDKPIDIAYSVDMNTWNGKRTLQLKVKDIHFK